MYAVCCKGTDLNLETLRPEGTGTSTEKPGSGSSPANNCDDEDSKEDDAGDDAATTDGDDDVSPDADDNGDDDDDNEDDDADAKRSGNCLVAWAFSMIEMALSIYCRSASGSRGARTAGRRKGPYRELSLRCSGTAQFNRGRREGPSSMCQDMA